MKARKNRAFFVETLIITFLLLLMLMILVRIFGAAAEKSQNAARMTSAAQAAQNVITMFEASEGEIGKTQQALMDEADEDYDMTDLPQTTLTFSFNGKGEVDPDGEYEVRLLIGCEVRAVGYMLTGNLTVANKKDPKLILAQLDTAKYFPDSVDIVLTGDGEFSFDDFAEIESETESEVGSDSAAGEASETESDAAAGEASGTESDAAAGEASETESDAAAGEASEANSDSASGTASESDGTSEITETEVAA